MTSASSVPEPLGLPVCASSFADGILSLPLAALDDPEGLTLPSSLPPVIDAHVHLFPGPLFEAIWRWFEQWGWPIRYRLKAPAVIDFLLERGVEQLVALHYAHKPGLAREMNRWMAEVTAKDDRVTGLATVYPGEAGARDILEEGFEAGLKGVKLHCHVQCFPPDCDAMEEVYRVCAERDLPLVMHAGREPKSPGYDCDPHALCSADRVEEALRSYPGLRLCVPHLGADEFASYTRLLERYDNLWLDTTMMLADYFPVDEPWPMLEVRPERIMYGSDFPNLPYAWDREVKRIAEHRGDDAELGTLLSAAARDFFGLR
ncbi:MAG: amidohydrolase family protein [Myxococcota bacterium]|nr:amidohydrolase family protein [Myxococcota bacterium]